MAGPAVPQSLIDPRRGMLLRENTAHIKINVPAVTHASTVKVPLRDGASICCSLVTGCVLHSRSVRWTLTLDNASAGFA